MNHNKPISMRIHRGVSGLQQLRPQWENLFASLRIRDIFCSFDWFDCYLRYLESEPDDVIFCAVSTGDGTLIAILPLQITNKRHFGIWHRELRLPMHPHLPLRDMIYSTTESSSFSITWLVRELRQSLPLRWDVLALEHVLPDSCILRAFSSENSMRLILESSGYCSYLSITDLDQLYSRLSKNFRSNLSRARNKLREIQHVTFETTRTFPLLHDAFQDFLDVEASGWKGEHGIGTAIKIHPDLIAFYRSLMKRFSENAGCEVNILRTPDGPIAAQFTLKLDETAYQLKIGYDERHSRLSPGTMLIENLLREYSDAGISRLNLISHTDWHRNWRADRYELFSLFFCNSTVVGSLHYAKLRIKQLLQPAFHSLCRVRDWCFQRKAF